MTAINHAFLPPHRRRIDLIEQLTAGPSQCTHPRLCDGDGDQASAMGHSTEVRPYGAALLHDAPAVTGPQRHRLVHRSDHPIGPVLPAHHPTAGSDAVP